MAGRPGVTPRPSVGRDRPSGVGRGRRRLATALAAAGVVLAVSVSGCASHTPGGDARLPQAPGWSSVAAGPANTGRADSAAPDSLDLGWSRALNAPAIGVPVTDGLGTLVQATLSDRGCNVFALSAEDGRKKWCLRLPTDGPRITATLDARGSVFLPQHDGVRAVSPEAEVRWSVPTAGVPTTVTLLDNRHLLVITHLGVAQVVNTQTGAEVTATLQLSGPADPPDQAYGLPWCDTGERGCPSPGPAAVDTDTATAYVTSWAPGRPVPDLVALRLVGGERPTLQVVWRVPLAAGRRATPPVLSDDGEVVYLHSRDDSLTAFSTADGATRWTAPVGLRPDTAPVLLPDHTLVTGGRSSTVWRGPGDDHSPDAGPSPVVAVRDEGGVGRVLWRRDDLTQLTNPVATTDGRVLVAVRDDSRDPDGIAVHLLDGAEGHTEREFVLPAATGPVSGLSMDGSGRVAVATSMGAVYLLG